MRLKRGFVQWKPHNLAGERHHHRPRRQHDDVAAATLVTLRSPQLQVDEPERSEQGNSGPRLTQRRLPTLTGFHCPCCLQWMTKGSPICRSNCYTAVFSEAAIMIRGHCWVCSCHSVHALLAVAKWDQSDQSKLFTHKTSLKCWHPSQCLHSHLHAPGPGTELLPALITEREGGKSPCHL